MKNKKLHIWIALAVIVFFVCIAVFGCGEDIKGIRDMRFGIDIRGGVEAVFEPSGLKKKPTAEQLEMAREVIETRLDSQNILDREVTVDEKAGDVIVRFPWKSDEKNFDPETAIQELGEMAELTFRGPDNTVYIKGSDVSRSQVAVDQQKNYVVELEFSSEGAKKFADATEKLVGQQMGIYMDDDLISNPTVNAKITGGKAEITGMSSKEEAQSLSDKSNSGSLPFSMKTTNLQYDQPDTWRKSVKCNGTGSGNRNGADLFIYDHMVPAAGSDQLSDTDVSDRTSDSCYFSSAVHDHATGNCRFDLISRYGGRCEYYYQ